MTSEFPSPSFPSHYLSPDLEKVWEVESRNATTEALLKSQDSFGLEHLSKMSIRHGDISKHFHEDAALGSYCPSPIRTDLHLLRLPGSTAKIIRHI